MKYALAGCLLLGSLLIAAPQESDSNVNDRYTVETVILAGKGWTANLRSETTSRISTSLLHQLTAIIGQKVNPAALDALAGNLKKELSAREVTHRLVRGETQDEVRVEFDVRPARATLGMNVNQFVYNSKENFSGSGEATVTLQQHVFALGLVDNGDWLPERYAGIFARYEDKHVGTDRLSFKFQAEAFHSEWNQASLAALASDRTVVPELYRARMAFEPSATLVLFKPLTVTVGARIERFEEETPGEPIQGANAAIVSLHYHQALEGVGLRQEIDADASVHSATHVLDGDYVYTLRSAGFRYQLQKGKHTLSDNVWAGSISGRAPLSDRFVLGNTYYLRGWNKFEIDPLGGNRALYNSVEYHYGPFQAFYDSGAVWNESQPIVGRQSVGIGLRESILSLAVAIPMRAGRVEPIFMMGILP